MPTTPQEIAMAGTFREYLRIRATCPCLQCEWDRRHPNAKMCPRCYSFRCLCS